MRSLNNTLGASGGILTTLLLASAAILGGIGFVLAAQQRAART